MIPLDELQRLYNQNRFLDAFEQTKHCWNGSSNLERFSVEELVLGGRLAARLAGWRLSRWLFRAASEREPENPLVIYFAQRLYRRRPSLLEHLREVETRPNLLTEDPELQSSWLAWHAVLWASLRDFTRARESIERARSFYSEDGWVASCESDVLGMADQWEEAWRAAEISWERSARSHFAARSLGMSLLHLGRVEEAATRLSEASSTTQSSDVVLHACWYLCTQAETLEGDARGDLLRRARELADELRRLSPLADRESRSVFARIRLDIAQLGDDHEEMERWAKEVRAPFYHRILANLRENRDAPRIRLPFRREIQKHDACLPTSVASALVAMGVHLDTDAMSSEITFGGTYDWAAGEWLTERGLAVRFFIMNPELARKLIHEGIAFILTLEGDDSSHAVAVIGIDEAAGTLLVHDPTRYRTTEYLLDAFGKSPLGPKAMVVVRPEDLPRVDRLLPGADVEVMQASQSHQRAIQLHGPTPGGAIVAELSSRHPTHPVTRLLQAVQADEEGRSGEALTGFQELLRSAPGHPFVRSRLLHACRSLGNTAVLRDVLESIVERGILPGVQSAQDWLYPPASYVWQYADLLRLSAATRARARRLLDGLLRRDASSAGGWHVLADLLWNERDVSGALLCYRIAACLGVNNEHYAYAYCDALGSAGREEEGLAWLEARVRAHGATAIGPWISWIARLESWGRPEKALEGSVEALERHGESPELLAFVIPFFARLGRWDEATDLLVRMESTGHLGFFHQAAVEFHDMQGEVETAIRHAEAWVREEPLSLRARSVLLEEISRRRGAWEAYERAARWLSEQPEHEGFEEVCCERMERADAPRWKKAMLLWRRVKRNREDAWAFRKLALSYLSAYSSATRSRRERLSARIEELVAECERTAPEEAGTWRARAMWLEQRGQWLEAVDAWLESVRREPSIPYGYRRAWECSARFDGDGQRAVWRRIESSILESTSGLVAAREVIPLVAHRFGLAEAEEVISRWRSSHPDEPGLTEAAADLLLDYGHGRTDAERALMMLLPAVQQFPFHLDLRFSLVQAHRNLGRFGEAEEAVREIVRRHPASVVGLAQLAWIHELDGRGEEARRLLESSIERDPQESELRVALVRILLRQGRLDEARRRIAESTKALPRSVGWREQALQLLIDCGDEKGAIDLAREGVRVHPRGAYLWLLLGEALDRLRRYAGEGEVEACFRRSLSLNAALFDAADLLALLLVSQRRYEEAEAVIREVEVRLSDPCPARGRLAWIHREQGRKKEAVDEMAALLKGAPWYAWGWSVVMSWLGEDRAWERARSLLGKIPPQIRANTGLRRERLRLLQSAGLEPAKLDTEWSQLLADFSDDVPLHLERYDSLQEAKRLPEAAAVLKTIRAVSPDDPWMNARLVEVLAREHQEREAVEVLLRVFFAPVEKSEWPCDHAWDVTRKARLLEDAFAAIAAALSEGSPPTPRGLHLWASYALERQNPTIRRPQPLWREWFPDSGAREVLRVLEDSRDKAWMDGRHRTSLFAALHDFGYSALVVRYGRRHREEVESHLDSWAQLARALIDGGRHREARELLSRWRERPGAAMWMVANYLECSTGLSSNELGEMVSTCEQALAGLPHDHCARYVAHVLAESLALLDERERFLSAFREWQPYFDGELDEKEWFHSRRRYLLSEIPELVRRLEEGQRFRFRIDRFHLRVRRVWVALLSASVLNKAKRIPGWTWFFLLLSILAVLVNL